MAEAKKKPRIRKTETYREKTAKSVQKAATKSSKPKRGRKVLRIIATPFRLLWRGLKFILRPFRFLLWPFKTRPMRFVGRLLGKIFGIGYFRNSWKELRLVTWPGRRETWKLTFAVFMFAIVFGTMIALVDYGLDKVFKHLILK